MTKHQYIYETPIGPIAIEDDGNGNIIGLRFHGKRSDAEFFETDAVAEAGRQLEEYFEGSRRSFDLHLQPEGTEFQRRVWKELCSIPFGETRTYGELAAAAGCPNGARAVGMAMNRNPIPIFQPCHRIIGSNGSMVGFAGGLEVKETLLRLEGALK